MKKTKEKIYAMSQTEPSTPPKGLLSLLEALKFVLSYEPRLLGKNNWT